LPRCRIGEVVEDNEELLFFGLKADIRDIVLEVIRDIWVVGGNQFVEGLLRFLLSPAGERKSP